MPPTGTDAAKLHLAHKKTLALSPACSAAAADAGRSPGGQTVGIDLDFVLYNPAQSAGRQARRQKGVQRVDTIEVSAVIDEPQR
jgi:hypothetical protein